MKQQIVLSRFDLNLHKLIHKNNFVAFKQSQKLSDIKKVLKILIKF